MPIEVQSLNVWYGKNQALHNINLQIDPLGVTALIGPSGCGKSTFLRSLNRMNDELPGTRVSGSIIVDGINIYSRSIRPMYVRRYIGMVFQQPNPLPSYSVWDNVAIGPRLNGIASGKALQELVEKSLHQAALWNEVKDRLSTPAGQLSGGQQQRLCIARGLAVDPKILLMDEPCSALDPASTMQIEELILQLKSQYTVVLVTHNMQQAGRVADTTAFFLQGKLIEVGDTAQFFAHPQQKETEEYITGRFS